jgi:Protein of unknown function (DUF4232)
MQITRRTVATTAALAVGAAAVFSLAAISAAAALTAPADPVRAAAAGASCQARGLSLRLAGTDTAVGTTALTVAIANHAATSCVLGGYPSMGLLRAGGAAQAARVSPGRGTLFTGVPDRPVRLAPGGQASFFITYRDFSPATGHPGPAVAVLRVSLPGVPGRFTVPARFAPYGGVSVSPIRAGVRKE